MNNVRVQSYSTMRDRIQSLCLLAGALLCLGLSGCAVNPVTGEHDFVMFGEETELEIGRANHSKIIAEYGRYEDEGLQAYVQSVGERLAAISHRNDLVYRFTVLDTPVINAFALPGGYIYITRGLMAYLNSEAELAAVLGHEIGHVTAVMVCASKVLHRPPIWAIHWALFCFRNCVVQHPRTYSICWAGRCSVVMDESMSWRQTGLGPSIWRGPAIHRKP